MNEARITIQLDRYGNWQASVVIMGEEYAMDGKTALEAVTRLAEVLAQAIEMHLASTQA